MRLNENPRILQVEKLEFEAKYLGLETLEERMHRRKFQSIHGKLSKSLGNRVKFTMHMVQLEGPE